MPKMLTKMFYNLQINHIKCLVPNTRSIILTATAAMAGGTQLFEGAHLTGGNTLLSWVKQMSRLRAFCGSNHQIRPSNNIRIWLKCAPFKHKFWLKRAPSNFWDLNKTNLIYFCQEFSSFVITRFLRGTFGQNLVTGALKHFNGPGS